MKVLVTGASGFIGSHVVPVLKANGHQVVAASRSPLSLDGVEWRAAPDLGPHADWSYCLAGVDVVVHLAGYAHFRPETKMEKAHCCQININGTQQLAAQAAESGVRHFIFISSIGAMTEASDEMLRHEDPCRPKTPYGQSKLAAESSIKELANGRCMAWTMIRPPLVYGPENPGNMRPLVALVRSGIPLPFGWIRNRKSLIYVENLADLIRICVGNPAAYGKTFLPSDGEDVSTPELIRAIARAAHRVEEDARRQIGDSEATGHSLPVTRYHSPRLFPFPESLLKVMGLLPGLGALRKLTSSLYVDSEPIRQDLDWIPPFSAEEGLRRTLMAPTEKADQ